MGKSEKDLSRGQPVAKDEGGLVFRKPDSFSPCVDCPLLHTHPRPSAVCGARDGDSVWTVYLYGCS